MDALSSIFTWPSEHEAGIGAVVGIAVLTGILLDPLTVPGFEAQVRFLRQ